MKQFEKCFFSAVKDIDYSLPIRQSTRQVPAFFTLDLIDNGQLKQGGRGRITGEPDSVNSNLPQNAANGEQISP
jgi:hypothetical protein